VNLFCLRFFIKNFNTIIQSNRPHIILKFAQSIDGYIGQSDKQVWLTNPYTKVLTHKWRSEIDGILIGTNTAQVDNPSLTNRLFFGSHPTRVIIDRNLKLNHHLAIFNTVAPTVIVNATKTISTGQVQYLQVDFDERFWTKLLSELHRIGIKKLMIEGGSYTLQSIIDKNLWDEARVLIAPKQLKEGITAPQFSGKLVQRHQLDQDVIEVYHPILKK